MRRPSRRERSAGWGRGAAPLAAAVLLAIATTTTGSVSFAHAYGGYVRDAPASVDTADRRQSGNPTAGPLMRLSAERFVVATEGRALSLPFKDAGLRSQVDDVVAHFDELGRPPAGVAQGGLRGQPVGTYGGQGLPQRPLGYYTESDVWASGQGVKRGAERLVFGQGGEVYYTPNHYDSFVRIP
jgi:guanyl-specific ribonuclease Sa